jgi:serine-type D-Ala-D-Ala carboxypeptidase/endopeptidase (penicillin-binding protein 4)
VTRRGAGGYSARMIPVSAIPAARRRLLLTLVGGLLLCPAAARADAAAEARSWLASRLAQLAADARIAPARVGAAVLDVRSKTMLVRLRATEAFNVASNVKLITSAAALALLGPEFRARTVLYAARPKGEVIEGDLHLKGFGDPSLSENDLQRMISELHELGVRRVRGGLVLDESYFDGQRLAPTFADKDTDQWYRTPNGPLSLEQNNVVVRVFGAETAGEPARVLLRPTSSHLKLINHAVTASDQRRSWVVVHTKADGAATAVEVKGRVRVGFSGKPFRRRIEDPGMFVGHALLDLLARRGIRVGRARITRGRVPEAARALVVHTSEPLALLLRALNKQSNNFAAEQVLKILGAEVFGEPGSWASGLKAVAQHLTGIGLVAGSYTMKNGSGLYDSNRFSPDQLVAVLRASVTSFKIAPDFVASLAIAGADGTLEHRFDGSGAERYVRAKTGTLADTVALSGLASSSAGRGPLVFSFVINGLPADKLRAGRAVVDEMASALVTFLER